MKKRPITPAFKAKVLRVENALNRIPGTPCPSELLPHLCELEGAFAKLLTAMANYDNANDPLREQKAKTNPAWKVLMHQDVKTYLGGGLL